MKETTIKNTREIPKVPASKRGKLHEGADRPQPKPQPKPDIRTKGN